MDRYTKVVLSLIAIGILGINYHLFKGEIVSTAKASGHVQKIAICSADSFDCARIFSGGRLAVQAFSGSGF